MNKRIGRPSKLTPALMEKARVYIHGGFMNQGEMIPTITGLSVCLRVQRQTLYRWAAANAEFCDTLGLILTKQEVMLVNNGLAGLFNSAITKLLLSNHGYFIR